MYPFSALSQPGLSAKSVEQERLRALAKSGLSDPDIVETPVSSLFAKPPNYIETTHGERAVSIRREANGKNPYQRRLQNRSRSGIYNLEPKLLTAIFEAAVDDITRQGATPAAIAEVNRLLLTLMHTSFKTRTAALATPLMWSFIYFRFHQGLKYRRTPMEWLRLHLYLSGNHDLHLYVKTTAHPGELWAEDFDRNVQVLTADLQPHLCRCLSIEIKEVGLQVASLLPLRGQFPRLRRLFVDRRDSAALEEVITKPFIAPLLHVLVINGIKRIEASDIADADESDSDGEVPLDATAVQKLAVDNSKVAFLPAAVSNTVSFVTLSSLFITDFTHTSALKALIYASKLPELRFLRLECSGSTAHVSDLPPQSLHFPVLMDLALHPGNSPLTALKAILAPDLDRLELSAPNSVSRAPTYWKTKGFIQSESVTQLEIVESPWVFSRLDQMLGDFIDSLEVLGLPLHPETPLREWIQLINRIRGSNPDSFTKIVIRSYVHQIPENAIYASPLAKLLNEEGFKHIIVHWNITTRPSGLPDNRLSWDESNELTGLSGRRLGSRWMWVGHNKPLKTEMMENTWNITEDFDY